MAAGRLPSILEFEDTGDDYVHPGQKGLAPPPYRTSPTNSNSPTSPPHSRRNSNPIYFWQSAYRLCRHPSNRLQTQSDSAARQLSDQFMRCQRDPSPDGVKDKEEGGAKIPKGSAHSSGAHSSGAHSSQGGAQIPKSGALSSQGGAQSPKDGAQSSLGGAQSSGAQSLQGGAQSSLNDTQSVGAQGSQGGAQSPEKGAQSSQGGTRSSQAVTQGSQRSAKSSKGGAQRTDCRTSQDSMLLEQRRLFALPQLSFAELGLAKGKTLSWGHASGVSGPQKMLEKARNVKGKLRNANTLTLEQLFTPVATDTKQEKDSDDAESKETAKNESGDGAVKPKSGDSTIPETLGELKMDTTSNPQSVPDHSADPAGSASHEPLSLPKPPALSKDSPSKGTGDKATKTVPSPSRNIPKSGSEQQSPYSQSTKLPPQANLGTFSLGKAQASSVKKYISEVTEKSQKLMASAYSNAKPGSGKVSGQVSNTQCSMTAKVKTSLQPLKDGSSSAKQKSESEPQPKQTKTPKKPDASDNKQTSAAQSPKQAATKMAPIAKGGANSAEKKSSPAKAIQKDSNPIKEASQSSAKTKQKQPTPKKAEKTTQKKAINPPKAKETSAPDRNPNRERPHTFSETDNPAEEEESTKNKSGKNNPETGENSLTSSYQTVESENSSHEAAASSLPVDSPRIPAARMPSLEETSSLDSDPGQVRSPWEETQSPYLADESASVSEADDENIGSTLRPMSPPGFLDIDSEIKDRPLRTDGKATIVDQLAHWARLDADGDVQAYSFLMASPPNLFHRGSSGLTTLELVTLARRFAKVLRIGYKVGKHSVVCCMLPSSPERLIVDMAIILAGGIVLCLDPHPKDNETDEEYLEMVNKALHYTVCDLVFCTQASIFNTYANKRLKAAYSSKIQTLEVIGISLRSSRHSKQGFLHGLFGMQGTGYQDDSLKPDQPAAAFIHKDQEGDDKLIFYTHQTILQLGAQMTQTLHLDRRKDVLFNPCSPSLPWGFPAAFLYSGVHSVTFDMMPYDDDTTSLVRDTAVSPTGRAWTSKLKDIMDVNVGFITSPVINVFTGCLGAHGVPFNSHNPLGTALGKGAERPLSCGDSCSTSTLNPLMTFERLAIGGSPAEVQAALGWLEECQVDVLKVVHLDVCMGLVTSRRLTDKAILNGDFGKCLTHLELAVENPSEPGIPLPATPSPQRSKPLSPVARIILVRGLYNMPCLVKPLSDDGVRIIGSFPWRSLELVGFLDESSHLHIVGEAGPIVTVYKEEAWGVLDLRKEALILGNALNDVIAVAIVYLILKDQNSPELITVVESGWKSKIQNDRFLKDIKRQIQTMEEEGLRRKFTTSDDCIHMDAIPISPSSGEADRAAIMRYVWDVRDKVHEEASPSNLSSPVRKNQQPKRK